MHPTLKLGHFQTQTTQGNPAANLAKVIEGLEYARRENVDLMCFPESFMSGFYMDASEARKHAWRIDGPEMENLLNRTAHFESMFVVGINELRDGELYNTAIVARRGQLIGRYSKSCAEPGYMSGREFPVFECRGVKFGVIICADGGFIEPTRILALKGARLIVAPHLNFIQPEWLLNHYRVVEADHIARAIENCVWFFRANSFREGPRDPGLDYLGVGYGDSYLIDPTGQIVLRSQLLTECFMSTTITFADVPPAWATRSRHSATQFIDALAETLRTTGE